MSKEQKISAKGTYVFDSDDIDALDELSLTSVMAEIEDMPGSNSGDRNTGQDNTGPVEPEPGNETINALLDDLDRAGKTGEEA